MPYGARKYLNLPNGVMKVVVASSKGHWSYPFRASSFVNTFALLAAMSATTSAGVEHWYQSCFTYLLRWERSTHILILSVLFLGVTTIGHTTQLVQRLRQWHLAL